MARTNVAQTSPEHVLIPVPRAALQIVEQPITISQRTSERALGLPRRVFLELAREFAAAGGEVIAVGKLRIVQPDPFRAWLARRSAAAAPRASAADVSDGVDGLMRELGISGVP